MKVRLVLNRNVWTWRARNNLPPDRQHLLTSSSHPQTLLKELERLDLNGTALDLACARMQRLVEVLALPGGLADKVSSTKQAAHLWISIRREGCVCADAAPCRGFCPSRRPAEMLCLCKWERAEQGYQTICSQWPSLVCGLAHAAPRGGSDPSRRTRRQPNAHPVCSLCIILAYSNRGHVWIKLSILHVACPLTCSLDHVHTGALMALFCPARTHVRHSRQLDTPATPLMSNLVQRLGLGIWPRLSPC